MWLHSPSISDFSMGLLFAYKDNQFWILLWFGTNRKPIVCPNATHLGPTAMTSTIEHYINDQRVSRDDRFQDVYNPATGA